MLLIHLDLPGPALAQLDWPLPAIVAGQGVTRPTARAPILRAELRRESPSISGATSGTAPHFRR